MYPQNSIASALAKTPSEPPHPTIDRAHGMAQGAIEALIELRDYRNQLVGKVEEANEAIAHVERRLAEVSGPPTVTK